ncbi:MAG: PKD domain-containing protein, partial [Bacteroidota bacterium]
FDCPIPPAPFTGGPYDGHAMIAFTSCPPVNIYVGGPYDGHDRRDTSACTPMNVFTGGPYDGHDRRDTADCAPLNIFAGGPYDGHDRTDSTLCASLNIFVGGPYDGFDMGKSDSCETLNIFAGGPYDGFDVNKQNGIEVVPDTICTGATATLMTTFPTDWYATETGGSPIATATSVFNTPPLTQTTLYWVEDVCYNFGRIPVQVCVLDSISPDAAMSINCAGQQSYFVNQTQIPGPSLPSFGSDITGFSAPNGIPPGPQQLSFSGIQTSNFGMLYDGVHNANLAWTGNNGGPATLWAQWNYLTPKSVNRFYYWNQNSTTFADRAPAQVRLYASNGGPWRLVKVFFPSSPSTGTYDSGLIEASNAVFATRWKLEFDVNAANGPRFGEFQVFASDPVTGGAVTWDFGDGNTSAQQNPIHVYGAPGNYVVTQSLTLPGTCPIVRTTPIFVDDCGPLAITRHVLEGRFDEQNHWNALRWRVEGNFESALFQKLEDGTWSDISAPFTMGPDSEYFHFDEGILWNEDNIYRVQAVDDAGQSYFSNTVVLRPEVNFPDGMIVFPNPITDNSGTVRVILGGAKAVKLEMVDLLGRVVKVIADAPMGVGVHEIPFETQGLAPATYIIRGSLGTDVLTVKIVVGMYGN